MSDRIRLTSPTQEQEGADVRDQGVPAPSFTSALLANVFQKVSESIAGPNRLILDPLATEESAEPFLPTGPESVDPDLIPSDPGEDFTPQEFSNLPEAAPFDPGSLPSPSEGKFVQTSNGLVRFTRGLGEAPDNKANRDHPAFQARAEFVGQVMNFVTENFDATPAGHFRSLDAEVTDLRSANSDHYSGGAFDVRVSDATEAQRILVWASQQPWVSFAQVYPDGTLVHISANIAAFTDGEEIFTPNPQPQVEVEPSEPVEPNEPGPQ